MHVYLTYLTLSLIATSGDESEEEETWSSSFCKHFSKWMIRVEQLLRAPLTNPHKQLSDFNQK